MLNDPVGIERKYEDLSFFGFVDDFHPVFGCREGAVDKFLPEIFELCFHVRLECLNAVLPSFPFLGFLIGKRDVFRIDDFLEKSAVTFHNKYSPEVSVSLLFQRATLLRIFPVGMACRFSRLGSSFGRFFRWYVQIIPNVSDAPRAP